MTTKLGVLEVLGGRGRKVDGIFCENEQMNGWYGVYILIRFATGIGSILRTISMGLLYTYTPF